MKPDVVARRDGMVGNAWRTAQDEKGDATNGIKTPDDPDTTGQKTRRTARNICIVGAQRGVDSGRTERE